jgi:hypothetical protein
MGNGIVASLDFKTIYVAASLDKRVSRKYSPDFYKEFFLLLFYQVRLYERHPKNNSLTYKQSLFVPFLVDNVNVNEYDQLVVAGHPNGILFLMHEKNPKKYRAPSEVIIFRDPKSSKYYFFYV